MDEPSVSPHRVTQLLAEWSNGDSAALAELTPLVYEEVRRGPPVRWEGLMWAITLLR